MRKIIALQIFFICQFAKAQTKNSAFILIDKRVKAINASSPDTLARKLTAPYKKDEEKVRAIFRWITENIAYDVISYHNLDSSYAGIWESSFTANEEEREKNYNLKIATKVLKEKRGVCDGYSRLFKTLCDYTNIKCEIISGYIRWSSDPIGLATKRRHSWNTVYINNSWKLIDVTWASGYGNHEVTQFVKRYDDFFFFPSPVAFFNDHFPDDPKWSLLPITPSLSQFYNYPFYHPDFYRSEIYSVKPTTGYLTLKKPEKIVTIEIESSNPKKFVEVYEYPFITDSSTIYNNGKITLDKNKIIASYKVQSDKAQSIKVYLNDKLILTYGLKYVN